MDELTSLVESMFGYLEKDRFGDYLVPVFVPELGTYEMFPVSEELAELLAVLENYLHASSSQKENKK